MSEKSQKNSKTVELEIEIEFEERLETSESEFKRDLDKIILTDKQKLEDSEKE